MLRPFDYCAPTTLVSLLELLEEFGERARPLAGGTDLLVDERAGLHSFSMAVDLKQVPELHELQWNNKSGLTIGAAVSMRDVMDHPDVKKKFPWLVDACHQVGSPPLRNRATVVGNLCTASPCTDLGRTLLAADARVDLASVRGVREVKLADFFRGVKKTVRENDEVVLRTVIPARMAKAKAAHEKLKRIRGHDLAVTSVTLLTCADELRLVIGACGIVPVLVTGITRKTSLKKILLLADKAIKPIDDVRASAEYRRAMVQAYIERLHRKVVG